MGTRRSRHNKGRKPQYKDFRTVAANILAKPRYPGGYWYDTGLHWSEASKFKLDVLCEADIDIEAAADAIGRTPTSVAHRARDFGLTLPKQWARLIAPKIKKRIITPSTSDLPYPYILKPRNEHANVIAINAIIPKSIHDSMRGGHLPGNLAGDHGGSHIPRCAKGKAGECQLLYPQILS